MYSVSSLEKRFSREMEYYLFSRCRNSSLKEIFARGENDIFVYHGVIAQRILLVSSKCNQQL